MAAAALSRGRGVAGGLLLVVSLLCLGSVATSLAEDFRLEILQESLQKSVKELEKERAMEKLTFATTSKLLHEQLGRLNLAVELVEMLSDESPPLREMLIILKRMVKKVNIYMDRKLRGFAAEDEDTEVEDEFEEDDHDEL